MSTGVSGIKNLLTINMYTLIILILLAFFNTTFGQNSPEAKERVYIDEAGIIRWEDSRKEVALFGANYCLPSACDYRAARYYTDDLKKEIQKDITHFTRMGWDGLRLCFWGDFQNSDSLGNLVNNEHLDLMDYLIYEAKKRGIKMLLSPIVTYSSQWPDAMNQPATGFSTFFNKSELGLNPDAIKAQVNYLQQLLNHVNPYTGTALKDEKDIIFIEMINEPWHHSDNFKASVNYVNALVNAVRSTGCEKILFHNVSQDFAIAGALKESSIQGVSYAWYPSGLVSGRTLKGNFLRTVDDYELMMIPELKALPRIVYEFDAPDLLSPVMYPAMVRTFRSTGSQFTAMFAYDMLITAKANLGWQTHFLNPVYSPQKAASAIIAAEAMRELPLYKSYGNYPDNTSFGPFRVSWEQNLSEYNTEDCFMYTENTESQPADIKKLSRIVGFHSSPVVHYDGEGLYFLDKVDRGVWRLELYPDAFLSKDPFAQMSPDKIVSRLVFRKREMRIKLPDLGHDFTVISVLTKEDVTSAVDVEFSITPGVYTLINKSKLNKTVLPDSIGFLGYNEYVVPEPTDLPLEIRHETYPVFQAGRETRLPLLVVDKEEVDSVKLFYRSPGSWFRSIKLVEISPCNYDLEPGSEVFEAGYYDYCFTVYQGDNKVTFPSGLKKTPYDWDFYSTDFYHLEILDEEKSFPVFLPGRDFHLLSFTRIGDNIRRGIFNIGPGNKPEGSALKFSLPINMDPLLKDYTASLYIGDRLANLKDPEGVESLTLSGRGLNFSDRVFITLVESDGTSWTAEVSLTAEWEDIKIPIDKFIVGKGVMLPQGFPGNWNYWLTPAKGRGGEDDKINLHKIEHLQISLRAQGRKDNSPGIEISSISVNTCN